MGDLVAVVMITKPEGRGAVDSEVRVTNLKDLFDACRRAPPSHLVSVSLRGPEGEVRLKFASFFRSP